MKKSRPQVGTSSRPVSVVTNKPQPIKPLANDEPFQAPITRRGRAAKQRFGDSITPAKKMYPFRRPRSFVVENEARGVRLSRQRTIMKTNKSQTKTGEEEEKLTARILRRSSKYTSPCGTVIQPIDAADVETDEKQPQTKSVKKKKRKSSPPPAEEFITETSYEAEILEARRRQKGKRKGRYMGKLDRDYSPDFDLHGIPIEPAIHPETEAVSDNNEEEKYDQVETPIDNVDDNVTVTFANVHNDGQVKGQDEGQEHDVDHSLMDSLIDYQNGSEVDFNYQSYTEKEAGRGRGKGRGKGRGSSKEPKESANSEQTSKQTRTGRRKGRQPRKVVTAEYSDESEEDEDSRSGSSSYGIMGSSRGQGKGHSRGNSLSKIEVSTVCLRCHADLGTLSALKGHLIQAHQAWWTPECPGGATDGPALTRILRQTGKLFCPNCNKEHHGVQYYKFHLDWCGREDERELCRICNRLQKRMFMSQHMYAHEKAQRDIERANARLTQMAERNKEAAAEGAELNKMGIRKRVAAKRALESINDLADIDPNPKRHKRRKKEVDVDYQLVETDELKSDHTKGPTNTKSMRKSAGHLGYNVFDSPDMFPVVCGILQAHEKADCIYPLLRPAAHDWIPLDGEERDKYLPETLISPDFSVTNKNVKSDIRRLMWTESYTTKDQSTIFVGGPIWGIEWCPIPCEESTRQFVAVVCDRSMDSNHRPHESVPEPGLVQIWSFGILNSQDKFIPQPVLSLSIAHDVGPVRCIKWCPSGAWENPVEYLNEDNIPEDFLPRLGLLAVACSTGEVFVYSIPHPEILSQPESMEIQSLSMVCKPPPSIVLQIRPVSDLGSCLSVAWQPGKECRYIMAGYAKGYVQIWDLATSSPLLVTTSPELQILPFRSFKAHQRMVMHCQWNDFLPTTFSTAGYDKQLKFWNLANAGKPFFQVEIGPVTACQWTGPLNCGVIVAKDDGYSLEHTGVHFLECGYRGLTGMFKGPLTVHNSCAWDVQFSPLFNFILSCDASGCIVGHKAVNLSEDVDMKNVAKRRFTIYNVELSKKCASDDQSEESFPPTYTDLVSTVDVEFLDREMDTQLKADRIAATYLSMPAEKYSRYPLQAIHKISLNPNLLSCMWLASGGQAGFLRLHQVTGMMSFTGKMFFKNKESSLVC